MDRIKVDRTISADQQTTPQESVTEKFSIRDSATGKARAVRKMTDQEIEKFINKTMDDLTRANQQMFEINKALQAVLPTANSVRMASEMLSVLLFEQHRRKLTIVIATSLNS